MSTMVRPGSLLLTRHLVPKFAVEWLVLFLLLIIVLNVNPIGFLGGGWDDWHYLDAARCWRAHGPCLPQNHWQGRWPVIAPIALVTGFLGESRFTVGIAPLIASIWCLVLLVLIGNRLFKPPVGVIAAVLLLCTAAFTIQLLDPAVEATELGFGLTGVASLLKWQRSPSLIWPALAGLAFGLALQVRETALVGAGFATLYVGSRHCIAGVRAKLIAVIMFLLPLAVEALSFYRMTADPLYRRRLSLHHTNIPSSELLGPIDYKRSALFNPHYIANWRREPGLHVHWIVDGLLNLFLNAKAGIALLLIPALILFYRRALGVPVTRSATILYGSAIVDICILIYAFAVDPKARMFFFPIAALSLALGLLLVRLHAAGHQLIAWSSAATAIGQCLFIVFIHQRVYPLERPAAAWIATAPEGIEIDENTRRHLALIPSAQLLPRIAGIRPMFLVQADVRCRVWAIRSGLNDDITLVNQQLMSRANMLDDRLSGELCLFRLLRPLSARRLVDGIAQADWYTLKRFTSLQLALR